MGGPHEYRILYLSVHMQHTAKNSKNKFVLEYLLPRGAISRSAARIAERESTMDPSELPLLSPGDRAAFEREMQGC